MPDETTPPAHAQEPQRNRGVTVAIVIGSLALIAAIIAIVLVTTGGDDEPTASPSPSESASSTPSATPTETEAAPSETPSPEPTETAGGSGTADDPYLLGETFTWDGAAVGGTIQPTTAVWEITIEAVEPTDVQSDEWSEYGCAVVTGTMTAVSWPDGQDAPAGEDMPLLSALTVSGDLGTLDDDGTICDVTAFSDLENYAPLGSSGWPGDEELAFFAAVNWFGDTAPSTDLVVLGFDDSNADTAVYVSATESLE